VLTAGLGGVCASSMVMVASAGGMTT
jgi:hypothetical protein